MFYNYLKKKSKLIQPQFVECTTIQNTSSITYNIKWH